MFADASCYQTQCLTISKLLLSVTESLEYFPITTWQRCAALMSLTVLCDHLIAQSPFSFMLHLPLPLFVFCTFNTVTAIWTCFRLFLCELVLQQGNRYSSCHTSVESVELHILSMYSFLNVTFK